MYYDMLQINYWMEDMAARFPKRVSLFNISTSYEGRKIVAMKVNDSLFIIYIPSCPVCCLKTKSKLMGDSFPSAHFYVIQRFWRRSVCTSLFCIIAITLHNIRV